MLQNAIIAAMASWLGSELLVVGWLGSQVLFMLSPG